MATAIETREYTPEDLLAIRATTINGRRQQDSTLRLAGVGRAQVGGPGRDPGDPLAILRQQIDQQDEPLTTRLARERGVMRRAKRLAFPPVLIRQARDLVKFIPQTAGVSAEMKEEVRKIYEEADQANREILY